MTTGGEALAQEAFDPRVEEGGLLGLLRTLTTSEGRAWRALARCRGMGPEVFFPEGDNPHVRPHLYDRARAVCGACPVQTQCRADGAHERWGMWGGLSPTQRHPKHRGRVPGKIVDGG